MTDKDGGPAFPQTEYRKLGEVERADTTGGLTILDYFAAQALAGMLSLAGSAEPVATARGAYVYADAMLAEREKQS